MSQPLEFEILGATCLEAYQSLEVRWLSLAPNLLKKAAVDAKNQEAKRKQAA